MSKISGIFDTRRDAEMSVEHLVQEVGIDRNAITIRPISVENSAGVEIAGADAKRGDITPAANDREDAALNGQIAVTLDTEIADSEKIRAVFTELGARQIRDS